MGGTIDVVIPVFNGARYIQAAIQSVQNQTSPAARIIVADDGSTDETVEVVQTLQKADGRIMLLRLQHKGVSSARNAGIAVSSATYVAFLDSDDIWLPNKLELQLNAFKGGGQGVGFVHSSYFFLDEAGHLLPEALVYPPRMRGDIFKPLLLEGYVLSGSASSVLVRRDVLDKAGYFDEELYHGEDWDLWIRLANISHVDFTPEAVVGIRVHEQSAQRRVSASRSLRFFRQQLLVYNKWNNIVANDTRLKKSLRSRAIYSVLPEIRRPKECVAFYRALSKDSHPFIKNLFDGPIDFWWALSSRLLEVVWFRLKRIVGFNAK